MLPLEGRHIQNVFMGNLPMRHLIERVLELSEDEQRVVQIDDTPGQGSEEELRALLESLQPRIRVYGVGGAGCNAINLSLIHI